MWRRSKVPESPILLHIGAGTQHLEGWLNLDVRPLPGVDLVADVTQGLAVSRADAVYAEHFLEHLWPDQALDFLTEVRRVLGRRGRLRLSTPNLDWVWRSHYVLEETTERKRDFALMINRAFRGWEHKFLWNREMLERALTAVGFRSLEWHRYGESESPLFAGIERHETYGDNDATPHVIIAEARPGRPRSGDLAALRQRFEREYMAHVTGGY